MGNKDPDTNIEAMWSSEIEKPTHKGWPWLKEKDLCDRPNTTAVGWLGSCDIVEASIQHQEKLPQ